MPHCCPGPAQAAYGVVDALADPAITLFSGPNVIARNDDWSADPMAVVEFAAGAGAAGAFAFAEGSADAAMVINLAPRIYTLQLGGVAGASGIGLIEVYEVP